MNHDAIHWPDELDSLEREHDAAIAEDDLAAEFAALAERKWVLKAIDHAISRLYFASEVRGHNAAREQADDAADALHAAGKLAHQPHRTALLRLSCRLNEAIDRTGHPNGGELEAVSVAAAAIKEAIRGETP